MPTPRLHVVSGKGGTGKTSVAAALALALAAEASTPDHDGRVLIAEVEGRQALARLFDQPPLGADPEPLAVAPDGGEVHGLAVDIEHAFLTYLDHILGGLRRTRPLLRRFGVVEFATQVMPGLRDLLLIDPVISAVSARSGPRPTWDAVVLDAPPTGRITRFLSVSEEVGSLAKVGGFAAQAKRVMSVLRSQETAVHLVSLLEPMPVQETQDAAAELTDEGFPLGLTIVNRARLDEVPFDALDAPRLQKAAVSADLDLDAATIGGLVAEAAGHVRRRELEAAEHASLQQGESPLVVLPLVADEMDLGGLYQMAAVLRPAVRDGVA
jgi:anion-transporting  ArsA/GET3 family ATPase